MREVVEASRGADDMAVQEVLDLFHSDVILSGKPTSLTSIPVGQPVTMRVNAITRTHAEMDAFQQAANAGVKGDTGRLFVDTELCKPCGQGGVKSLARQLGLRRLEVVTPSGVVVIEP